MDYTLIIVMILVIIGIIIFFGYRNVQRNSQNNRSERWSQSIGNSQQQNPSQNSQTSAHKPQKPTTHSEKWFQSRIAILERRSKHDKNSWSASKLSAWVRDCESAAFDLAGTHDTRASEPIVEAMFARNIVSMNIDEWNKLNKMHRRDMLKHLISLGDPNAIDLVLAKLQSTDAHIIFDVADVLAIWKNPASLDAIARALKEQRHHSDVNIHYPETKLLLDALVEIGGKDVIESLIAIGGIQATTALGKLGDKRAIDILLPALEKHNIKAVIALGEIKIPDARIIQPLVDIVIDAAEPLYILGIRNSNRRKGPHPAWTALTEISDTRMIPMVVEKLRNEDTRDEELFRARIGEAHSLLAGILSRKVGEITQEDLELLAKLPDRTHTVSHSYFESMDDSWQSRDSTEKVNNSDIRNRATEELSKRGIKL